MAETGGEAQQDEARAAEALEFGRRLRALRAKAGVTRRQLAQLSSTSERYLAHLEAGTGNPSLSVMTALAQALDVAVANLLPRGGELTGEQAAAAARMRGLSAEHLVELTRWLHAARAGRDAKAGRITLLGLRGAGKTSLGSALAERLDMPFFEMSREVEAGFGGDVRLLIELNGQAALRHYEREAWNAICRRAPRAVIAASGGVVADGPLYDRILSSAHCVWLKAAPDDHMERVIAQGDFRPMASNRGAMEDLKAILAARGADYARADASLDTSAQDFAGTLDLLEELARDLIAA